MTRPFCRKQYFALTIDPVHVGAGGYRLGHVDNTILRESGTHLPKIPGSSLNGVLRACTAMALQNSVKKDVVTKEDEGWVLDCPAYRKLAYLRPVYELLPVESMEAKNAKVKPAITGQDGDSPMIKKDKDGKDIYHSCAGKGGKDGQAHCGRHDCPVCLAFGFSIGDRGSFQGLVQFHDMHILFFPVHTNRGTVWLTSPSALEIGGIQAALSNLPDDRYVTTMGPKPDVLYMGGFKFEKAPNDLAVPETTSLTVVAEAIRDRMVVLSDECFSRMVNANLEVRTSVSINPETGAAEDGALFTYEAIPRSTVLCFDLIYGKPEFFRIKNQAIELTQEAIKQHIEQGMRVMEALGIGGMNTRGMGRLRVLNLAPASKEEK